MSTENTINGATSGNENSTMGSANRVDIEISDGEMDKAITAFKEYRTKVNAIYQRIIKSVNRLGKDSFSGQAANSFQLIYQSYIQNLLDPDGALSRNLSAYDNEQDGRLIAIKTVLNSMDSDLSNQISKNLGNNDTEA